MSTLLKYKSFRSKESDFPPLLINTPQEFDEWYSKIEKQSVDEPSIFRGLSEASYKLYTSAQRAWLEKDMITAKGDDVKLFHEFINKLLANSRAWQANLLERYYEKLGHTLSDLALLAIMQHYGLPTPIIDFTKSLDIALSFAVNGIKHMPSDIDIDNYFSLYKIPLELNKQRLLHLTELYQNEGDNILEFSNLAIKNQLVYLDTDNSQKLNLIHYSNFNIINQQGVFLFNPHHFKYITCFNTDREIVKGSGTFYQIDPPEFPVEVPVLNTMDCVNIHKSLKEYINSKYLNQYSDNFIYPTFDDFKNTTLKKTLETL